MGQDGQIFSLSQGFQKSAESSDIMRTTEFSKEQEIIAHNYGMGDGLALENSGLMGRNNSSNKHVLETERKKRDKQAYERALELMSERLNAIQTDMDDLEQKIADSRLVIAENESDIDFIRSLDTDNLYGANGEVRDDVSTLLKKHGYDDLDGKSYDNILHMLTAIEVQAIEQNEIEQDKIEGWLDRHGDLRKEAQETMKGYSSETHQDWAKDLAGRDPEILARNRLEAMENNKSELTETAKDLVLEAKVEIESQGFSL